METKDKKLEYVQPAMEVVALDDGAALLAGSDTREPYGDPTDYEWN